MAPPKVYLDLRIGYGIGNVVMSSAGFAIVCRVARAQPVILVNEDSEIPKWFKPGIFRFITEEPPPEEEWVETDPLQFINLSMLANPALAVAIREIVQMPPDVAAMAEELADVKAGFCIRTSDPTHDGETRFSSPEAIATMRREMLQYDKVFVCSNDKENLRDLPPNAIVLDETKPEERNTASHWLQWHALALCPVVFHGTGWLSDGSIPSTFAPTAAVYGGSHVVGVRNDGVVLEFANYRW